MGLFIGNLVGLIVKDGKIALLTGFKSISKLLQSKTISRYSLIIGHKRPEAIDGSLVESKVDFMVLKSMRRAYTSTATLAYLLR